MSAALAAAESGARVIVLDDGAQLGGALAYGRYELDQASARATLKQLREAIAHQPLISVLNGTLNVTGKIDAASITTATNGTITGALDNTKSYYRTRNTLNTAQLPTLYSGNTVVNNINTVNSVNGVLVAGRPWS